MRSLFIYKDLRNIQLLSNSGKHSVKEEIFYLTRLTLVLPINGLISYKYSKCKVTYNSKNAIWATHVLFLLLYNVKCHYK